MYNYYPWYPMQQSGGFSPYAANMGVRQQNGNGNGNGDGNGMLSMEQSYIENILRLNRGKRANVYMTFEGNPDWQSMVFRGIIDEAGRDHIVLRDPEAGRWYLLLMVYLDYVVFDEEINYQYPFE
ncbi:spore coat protein GerQ [Salibacterium aidingense]|uniref:spore coat protein GerQ n=1 Tax=Salibacterium aidingense TaxID=384933 RepID=UPI003BBFA582